MRALRLMAIVAASLLLGFSQAGAIVITETTASGVLATELFKRQRGVTITGHSISFGDLLPESAASRSAAPSGEPVRSGLYTNESAVYGLTLPGIALSTGRVADYGAGPNTSAAAARIGVSTRARRQATSAQSALLRQVTGSSTFFDPVHLSITFDAAEDLDRLSLLGVFGSEEFPLELGAAHFDGFGLFLNGQQFAMARTGVGSAKEPVTVKHPAFKTIEGTELDGVLAPGGDPVLRFSAPVTPGSKGNRLDIIIGDTLDARLDSTVYLTSFGDYSQTPGRSETDPIIVDANEEGAFEFDLVFDDLEGPTATVWIDPPVAVGYVYTATDAVFFSVTAPSTDVVPDFDGYEIVVDGVTHLLDSGDTFFFGDGVTRFELRGIDPALMLDEFDPVAFPLGVQLAGLEDFRVRVTQVPIIEDYDPNQPLPSAVVPLPGSALLYMGGLGALGWLVRRRRA